MYPLNFCKHYLCRFAPNRYGALSNQSINCSCYLPLAALVGLAACVKKTMSLRSKPLRSFVDSIYQLLLLLAARRASRARGLRQKTMSLRSKPLRCVVESIYQLLLLLAARRASRARPSFGQKTNNSDSRFSRSFAAKSPQLDLANCQLLAANCFSRQLRHHPRHATRRVMVRKRSRPLGHLL